MPLRSRSPASARAAKEQPRKESVLVEKTRLLVEKNPKAKHVFDGVACDAAGVPLREEVAPLWHPEGPLGHLALIVAVPLTVIFVHTAVIKYNFDVVAAANAFWAMNGAQFWDLLEKEFAPTWTSFAVVLGWMGLQVFLSLSKFSLAKSCLLFVCCDFVCVCVLLPVCFPSPFFCGLVSSGSLTLGGFSSMGPSSRGPPEPTRRRNLDLQVQRSFRNRRLDAFCDHSLHRVRESAGNCSGDSAPRHQRLDHFHPWYVLALFLPARQAGRVTLRDWQLLH
jgi:hypothetical protein